MDEPEGYDDLLQHAGNPLSEDWNFLQSCQKEHEELAEWRSIGARLWPFIRPWGLCGAHPDALKALEDMANLLGVDGKKHVDANVELLARKRLLEDIATDFDMNWSHKMLRKDREAFLEHLRSL